MSAHVFRFHTCVDQVDNATDPAGLADHAHLFSASSGARPVYDQSDIIRHTLHNVGI